MIGADRSADDCSADGLPVDDRAGLIADLTWAAVAGAFLAASGRPWGPWWAAIAAGALLWPRLVRAPAPRAAVLATIALLPVPAIGYEGLRVYDAPAWWAVALGVAAGYGAVGAVAAGLAARAWPLAPLAWRPLPWALAWAGLDLILSHARPWPLPFPVTPGYALVGGPLVALAALGGPAALGAAWVVCGVALAGLARGRSGLPGARAWPAAAAAAVLAAASLHGLAGAAAMGTARTVAIAQRPSEQGSRLEAFTSLAFAAAADLHLWPEAALGKELADDAAPLGAVARDLGSTVLAGALRRDEVGGWRNAAALADRHGVVFVVDKRWLVPGYEAHLTPGVGERWPPRAAGWRLGVLLCWESLFLDEGIQRVRDGADLIVVLAHDGWAAGTSTPWWHARAGRLLAWSLGRPVAVASHDGPSMVWAHDGRLLARAGTEEHVLRVAVAPPTGWRTPYVALGQVGLAALWLGAVAWVTVGLRRGARGGRRQR